MSNIRTLPIALPMDAIRRYCQKWGVVELALFGSVLREDFTETSDIDVLVKFHENARRTLFDLVAMGDELETIFGRKVDLVTRNAVEHSANHLRRRSILNSAVVIYEE